MKQERFNMLGFFSEWKQLMTGKTVVNFCYAVKGKDITGKLSF
jgi:hypothetical protein